MAKKSILKLNSDAPAQHMALLAVVGVIIFLSIVDAIKGPSVQIEPEEAVIRPGESRYVNPQMNWYERIFCRGYQRSFKYLCSYRLLHPLKSQFEADNKTIREAPPPSDGVVLYRGHLKGQKNPFGGKIQLDLSGE
jgi:hypothetical protein